MPIRHFERSERIEGIGVVRPLGMEAAAGMFEQIGSVASNIRDQQLTSFARNLERERQDALAEGSLALDEINYELRRTHATEPDAYRAEFGNRLEELIAAAPTRARDDLRRAGRQVQTRSYYELLTSQDSARRSIAFSQRLPDWENQIYALSHEARTEQAFQSGFGAFLEETLPTIAQEDLPRFYQWAAQRQVALGHGVSARIAQQQQAAADRAMRLQRARAITSLRADLFDIETNFLMTNAAPPEIARPFENGAGPLRGPMVLNPPMSVEDALLEMQVHVQEAVREYQGNPEIEVEFLAEYENYRRRFLEERLRESRDAQVEAYRQETESLVAVIDRGLQGPEVARSWTEANEFADAQRLAGTWSDAEADNWLRERQQTAVGTMLRDAHATMLVAMGAGDMGNEDRESFLMSIDEGTLELPIGEGGTVVPLWQVFDEDERDQMMTRIENTDRLISSLGFESVDQMLALTQFQRNLSLGLPTGRSSGDVRTANLFYERTGLSEPQNLFTENGPDLLAQGYYVQQRTGVWAPALRSLLETPAAYGLEDQPAAGWQMAVDVYEAMTTTQGDVGYRMVDSLPNAVTDPLRRLSELRRNGTPVETIINEAGGDISRIMGRDGPIRNRNAEWEAMTPEGMRQYYESRFESLSSRLGAFGGREFVGPGGTSIQRGGREVRQYPSTLDHSIPMIFGILGLDDVARGALMGPGAARRFHAPNLPDEFVQAWQTETERYLPTSPSINDAMDRALQSMSAWGATELMGGEPTLSRFAPEHLYSDGTYSSALQVREQVIDATFEVVERARTLGIRDLPEQQMVTRDDIDRAYRSGRIRLQPNQRQLGIDSNGNQFVMYDIVMQTTTSTGVNIDAIINPRDANGDPIPLQILPASQYTSRVEQTGQEWSEFVRTRLPPEVGEFANGIAQSTGEWFMQRIEEEEPGYFETGAMASAQDALLQGPMGIFNSAARAFSGAPGRPNIDSNQFIEPETQREIYDTWAVRNGVDIQTSHWREEREARISQWADLFVRGQVGQLIAHHASVETGQARERDMQTQADLLQRFALVLNQAEISDEQLRAAMREYQLTDPAMQDEILAEVRAIQGGL